MPASSTRVIEDGLDFDMPFNEPPKRSFVNLIVYGLLSVSVIILIATLAWFNVRAAKTETVELPPSPAAVKVTEYGFERVKADLLYLRRKLARHDRYNQVINYTGIESRLFRHVQSLLAPGACNDIVSLRLNADSPRSGFTLQSTCLEPKQKGAAFDIRFMGGWAVVRNQDTGRQLDFPLLANAQREWDQGARQYKAKEDGPDA